MTEYMVQVNLRVHGAVDAEDGEDARRVAKEILQGGLADAGWSSDEGPADFYPLELDGVPHMMPAKIPPLSIASVATSCESVSPTGLFRCTLPRYHALRPHVATGNAMTLAIWR